MNSLDVATTLARAVEGQLGHPVHLSRSRDHFSLTWGYARVEISHDGLRVLRFRREGHGDRPTFELPDATGNVLEWCVHALSTGRTVECGTGAMLPDRDAIFPYAQANDIPADHLAETMARRGEPWNLEPAYQRGAVWTAMQREAFLGHWVEGGPVPKIYVNRPDVSDTCEVIDGQQRLRAFLSFLRPDGCGARLTDGRTVYWRQFHEGERARCSIRIDYVDLTLEARLLLYIRLNTGGTAHTESDIERALSMLLVTRQAVPS